MIRVMIVSGDNETTSSNLSNRTVRDTLFSNGIMIDTTTASDATDASDASDASENLHKIYLEHEEYDEEDLFLYQMKNLIKGTFGILLPESINKLIRRIMGRGRWAFI